MLHPPRKRRRLGTKKQTQSLWSHLPPDSPRFHPGKLQIRRSLTHLQRNRNHDLRKTRLLQCPNRNHQHEKTINQKKNPRILRSHRLPHETTRRQNIHRKFLLLPIQTVLPNPNQNRWTSQIRSLPQTTLQIFHQINQNHHLLTVFGILQNRQTWIHGPWIWSLHRIYR